MKLNTTIRIVFGLFAILFPSALKDTLLVIKNFGSIDLLKKINLLKFFRRVSKDGSGSQVIAIDYVDNESYGITASATTTKLKTSSFIKDPDTNKYVFSDES